MLNSARKSLLLSVFLLAPLLLFAQEFDNGIGLRLGDPFGFTYKKYISPTRAVEFIAGTSGNGWSTNYYKKSFQRLTKFDDYLYFNHRLDYTVALNARYLFHNKFRENVDGLQWYYGAGLHMRFASVEYETIRREDIDNFQQADRFFEGHYNLDIGPEAIIGAEYTLYDLPITVFGEVSLLAEVVDNPFAFRFFGAFGIRYNFNN